MSETTFERRNLGMLAVQLNPRRIVSTGAKIDTKSLAERPCFLCRENRPAGQPYEEWTPSSGRLYELLFNPFPILPNHRTIPTRAHEPQTMDAERLQDMKELAERLPWPNVVFYNGPHCGASAPDHAHFQAGEMTHVPLVQRVENHRDLTTYPCRVLVNPKDFEGIDIVESNILVWHKDGRTTTVVIPRRKHRPTCYPSPMISPGAIDMSGLLITPQQTDYESLTSQQASEILAEVGFPWTRPLSVGIMRGKTIRFKLDDGAWLTADKPCVHRPEKHFTLDGVTIGVNFHWQRQQEQRFEGQLRIVRDGDELQVINDIDVEKYLESVIASEMNGEAPLEFLKAHAVISRSWVMNAMKKQTLKPLPETDEHIVIYERDAHRLFDVCADDHCQRYQGLHDVPATVKQAIDETRGMVLTYDGAICDARFYKACGGKTERFSTCWADEDYPYLQPVDCPYCDTHDEELLKQVLNDYDQETPDFYRWTVRYTPTELANLIRQRSGFDFGNEILDLQPLSRGDSGRIYRLKVIGTKLEMTVGKELEIRRWLSPTHLYSSAFDVTRENGDFVLHGKGWGHGVGLCQIGAAVMASEGKNYQEILAHYYSNAELTKIS